METGRVRKDAAGWAHGIRPRGAGRRAFTLIEMVVVIFIIAILSAIAVPSYGRLMARARFDHGVQEVVSVLRWARDAAVESAADSIVRFDPQEASFHAVVQPEEPTDDLPTVLQEQAQQESQAAPAPKQVVLSEHLAVIQFEPLASDMALEQDPSGELQHAFRFRADGSSNGGRLVLGAPDEGYAVELEIQPTTGRVLVRDAMEAQFGG